MKSTTKILSLLLALSLCFALTATLVACGGTGNTEPGETPGSTDTPTDNKIAYTVTIKDKDGNAVPGVKLMISDNASVFKNAETGADGKAIVNLDAASNSLGVMLTTLPDGYVKPATVSGAFHAMFGSNREVSLEINKPVVETITYTVKVVDQNGDAVSGVELQICHTSCVQCDLTDANGETKKELSSATVEGKQLKVGILDVPAGYTIPAATIDGAYHAVFADGETTIVVEIEKN